MIFRSLFASAVTALALTALVSAAQAPQAPARTIWDGIYTTQQAEYGAFLYGANCARCHGDSLAGRADDDGDAAPLVGAEFWRTHQGKTLDSMFTVMKTRMPLTSPGSLRDSDYASILAFILSVNEFPAGATELPATALGLSSFRFVDAPAAPAPAN